MKPIIGMMAEGTVWMAILCNLNIALAHQQNKGPSRKVVEKFYDDTLATLEKAGAFDDLNVDDQILLVGLKGQSLKRREHGANGD